LRKKRILLVAIDSKYPNLALAKVKKHFYDHNFLVGENYKKLTQKVEAIYVSCLFTWNLDKALAWKKYDCPVYLGGSGISLTSKLPEEIDLIKPRINWGYTSRGCIRRCPWCSVHIREGSFKVVGDLLDLWDGSSKEISLLDNNILADPDHFNKISWQAITYRIRLNFFQGLDFRLINRSVARTLQATPHSRLRLSFDEPKNYDQVDYCITELEKVGIRQNTWFVLVGFNTTFEEDLYRINFLRRRGQKVYLARYDFIRTPQNILLARWTQSFKYFAKLTFTEFIRLPQNRLARLRAGINFPSIFPGFPEL